MAGSAIQAFEEVCPERIDLIHKNYRKLCNLLVDVEEWGQVVIINMLTRYIRTQFINPNEDEVPACCSAFVALVEIAMVFGLPAESESTFFESPWFLVSLLPLSMAQGFDLDTAVLKCHSSQRV